MKSAMTARHTDMPMASYVELHLHTAYSFLDGASLPEEFIARAADLGYTALASTDHDGLYGAMEFAQAAHAANIQPITGAELTLDNESHLTFLAETPQGYGNLSRLITAAYHSGERHGRILPPPRLDPNLLPQHASGLILLTGCRQSDLARLVDAGKLREAEDLLRRYIDWFGADNVVVELQQNLVFGDTRRIDLLVQLADHLGLRYAATGNVHYHDRARHRLQDVLVAIHSARHAGWLASGAAAELRVLPALTGGDGRALQPLSGRAQRPRSRSPSAARAFDLTRDLSYRFPDYPTEPDETPDDVLARVCREALARSATATTLSRRRRGSNQELTLIAQHKLAGFFLLYRDLLMLARKVAD